MKHKITILVKTIGWIGLTFLILFFVEGKPLGAAEPIKIGSVHAVTGRGGFLGTGEKEAITIITDEVNRQGGILGRQIEVNLEDDQSNPTNAAIAVTKLIRDKKVCCVIGSSLVADCMAMIPICESEGVANLPLAPVYESAVPFRKWVFKIGIIDNRAALRILMFTINTLGARKIALLHSSDTYGMTGAEVIMGNINKYGASIVIKEQFEPTDTNMIPQLTKVKAANPDAIILYANAGPAAVIAKNYQQLGLETPVVGSHGIPRPEFPQLAGKIVEGGRWIIFGSKVSYAEKLPPDDPWRKNLFDPLMKSLKEKYGRTGWPATAGNAHDALRMAIEAIKISGTDDRTALRDALEKVKFQGLMGDYAYSPTDHDGASGEDLVPIIIKDGTYWPYKK